MPNFHEFDNFGSIPKYVVFHQDRGHEWYNWTSLGYQFYMPIFPDDASPLTAADGDLLPVADVDATNDLKYLSLADLSKYVLRKPPEVEVISSLPDSLALSENGKVVIIDVASDGDLTIPSGMGWEQYDSVTIINIGVGDPTLVASGTTLNKHADYTLTMDGQHSVITLFYTGSETFQVWGQLKLAP